MTNNKRDKALDNVSKADIGKNKPKIRLSLLGKSLLIRGENKRKFEELRAKILKEIGPVTEIERVLCDKFISAVFKHDRAVEVERNMLNIQNQPNEPVRAKEEAESWQNPFSSLKRVRNIRRVSLDGPDIQKVLKYQVALEKNSLKILERIREEQRNRVLGASGYIVRGTVG